MGFHGEWPHSNTGTWGTPDPTSKPQGTNMFDTHFLMAVERKMTISVIMTIIRLFI